MYLRTRAHLRRIRQGPRNFFSPSFSRSLPETPLLLSFSSLLVTPLLKRLSPYCFFGKYREEPSSLLLCNESGITARRELSKFIRPMRSRRYESPLDRPTRNFIRYTAAEVNAFKASSWRRARTDEHNRHTGCPLRSEELRRHIVVARVSATTSTLP
jgi:hypothetical protein